MVIADGESFSMNIDLEFQMVCCDCGSLAIKIENPTSASRETIVHCGECGASRGTIGALRDLAVRANILGFQTTVAKGELM